MMRQIEIKDCKKGAYIMIDDIPCVVLSFQSGKTGKHGHAKVKIDAEGIIDGKRRFIAGPTNMKVQSPIIDKRTGQVLSVQGNIAQLMDTENYETFNTTIPEHLKGNVVEGGEVAYWVIGETKVIMDTK